MGGQWVAYLEGGNGEWAMDGISRGWHWVAYLEGGNGGWAMGGISRGWHWWVGNGWHI